MRTLGASVLLFFCCVSVAAAKPPNIVLIIGDDIEWSHYGFMGHPIIQTPNLDRLAAEGVVFTQGQVPASICRPTLQTLLSGLHPSQWDLKRDALPPAPHRHEVAQYRTLPRELQRRGYLSWEGGKFWEGSYAQAGFTHGLATEPSGPLEIGGRDFGRGEGAPLEPLLEFLDGVGRRPFFLWFAPKLPHIPFDPPQEFLARYFAFPSLERRYYAQVTRLDALIGALLEELEARGLRRNTLIVYLGDNGWGRGILSPGPGGKGSLYDSGTRTPIIFSWPGRIAAGTREEVIAAEDLFPTLLSFAGLPSPPDRNGVSLRAVLGRGAAVPRQNYVSLQYGYGGGLFVRTQEWRYFLRFNLTEELYHIPTDPYEQENLAAVRRDVLERFREDALDWMFRLGIAPERLEALGRLVDEYGQPVQRRWLRLVGEDGTHWVRTDRRGWLLLPWLSAGDYRLCGLDFSLPVGPTGAYLGDMRLPCREPQRAHPRIWPRSTSPMFQIRHSGRSSRIAGGREP